MRLLARIPHPRLLISIFKNEGKYILKFEIGPFEQVYKFLESDTIYDADSLGRLVTEDVLKEVLVLFDQMNLNYKRLHG